MTKAMHKAISRGYLSLAASRNIPIWKADDVYVLEFPAGIITFPKKLIGELLVPDHTGDFEKPTLAVLAKRLEDPLLFPLPDKVEV